MPVNYEELFSSMKVRDDWELRIVAAAEKIILKKITYQMAVDTINHAIPWYFLGIVHMMECNCRFDCHLHNGDTLLQRTTRVPKGRPTKDPMNGKGKPYTWIESAADAFGLKGYDVVKSWTLAEMLYRFESYNGFGYEKYHNMNSPYLWSGSNHYEKGKYIIDGHFDPDTVSKQVGAALLLRYCTDKTLGLV